MEDLCSLATSDHDSNARCRDGRRMDQGTTPTLARRLERDRVLHRTARIERVVRELRRRAEDRRRLSGSVPAPLGLAIKDFENELRGLRTQAEHVH
jgi:hypothetical protein